jgi:cytoskeleton protein RodZ
MESVAAELKTEREKRNISLEQISADTHISLRHLKNLEAGRFGDLPGGMYNRAFLKAYCESIHLDQYEIVRRYEAEESPRPEKPPRHKAPQMPSTTRPSKYTPVVIWSLMLLISATGIYFSRSWIKAVFSPYFTHAPAASPRFEAAASTIVPQATGSSVAVDTSSLNPSLVPEGDSMQPSSPSPGLQTPPQTPGPAPAIPETDMSLPSDASALPLNLELAATETCWISIDRDGERALQKLLEPGEIQSLSAADEFYVVLGNAGGVHLKINGRPAKQLGKSGEVKRLLINDINLPNLIDQTAG